MIGANARGGGFERAAQIAIEPIVGFLHPLFCNHPVGVIDERIPVKALSQVYKRFVTGAFYIGEDRRNLTRDIAVSLAP